jgi:hypothetical protein
MRECYDHNFLIGFEQKVKTSDLGENCLPIYESVTLWLKARMSSTSVTRQLNVDVSSDYSFTTYAGHLLEPPPLKIYNRTVKYKMLIDSLTPDSFISGNAQVLALPKQTNKKLTKVFGYPFSMVIRQETT